GSKDAVKQQKQKNLSTLLHLFNLDLILPSIRPFCPACSMDNQNRAVFRIQKGIFLNNGRPNSVCRMPKSSY
ncbi:MAG: hypothetical protein ACYSTR_10305, partial [Planctomycetota bacterium]